MREDLQAAFRLARYCIDAPGGELVLTVDHPSIELAALLRERGTATAAVITAFNPQGQLRDDTRNCAAQEQLRRELAETGYHCLPGRNEDPAGAWPVEESLLVFGISCASALALAARYNQAAILWAVASDATPRMYCPTPPAA